MQTRTSELAGQVRGPVLEPGDDGYDEERTGFQLHRPHQPAVVVGAGGVADVQAAVRYAAARDLGVAVQATGHGLPVAAAGGVLVSTRRMAGVRVDPQARTAWVEAGVRWSAVIDAAAPYGLAPLSGSAPHTGAVAYTLGGGVGLLARKYGYAADHVRRIEVVTADGAHRRVTAVDEPELFWALRGGRANFGVVTGIEIDLVPVATVYGGGLYFDADLAGDVWHAYREWTATAPVELTSSIALLPFPDVPGVPDHLRGRHVTHLRVSYAGDAAAGERLVAPLRALGPRLDDTVRELPYAESGTIHAEPTQPLASRNTHRLLRGLDAGAVQALLERAGPGGPDPCVLEVRHLGGALAEEPAVPNAVGNRAAAYTVGTVARLSAEFGAPDAAALQERVLDTVRPWSTDGQLLNFLFGADATAERVRAAYEPGVYRRLAELKAAYDPANLFRHNHNIPPG